MTGIAGLAKRRILVVEDDYLIASNLVDALEDEQVEVIGPVATVEAAIRLINDTAELGGALLDVNLRGEPAYPVADVLLQRRVPFVFTTGYDSSAIPDRYAQVARCQKPADLASITTALLG